MKVHEVVVVVLSLEGSVVVRNCFANSLLKNFKCQRRA